MGVRRAATSATLGLLFLSLVAIYLLIPQNNLVMFLCILILIVSLIVAQSPRWRDIGIMAIFAAIVSLVAAYLFGRSRFGPFGSAVVTLVWAGVLFALFSWTRRNTIAVPEDRAIVVRNNYSGGAYIAERPIAPPLIPLVESRLAVIPLYELADDVQIDKANTKRMNVDRIDVQVHYRVADARRALTGIPNRSQAQSDIAKEMSKSVDEARLDVTFWEKLLSRQMRLEVDDIVREVVYDNPFAQNPIEVYSRREDLAEIVRERLSKAVSRWGVELTSLLFEGVDISTEVRRAINKASIRDEETMMKETEAKRDAKRIRLLGEAQAEAERQRVTEMVTALQKSGVELSPDVLREIVVSAIYALTEANIESTLTRPMLEGPAPRPASGGKDNGAKK